MRIRFLKKTKDIREGRTKFYRGIPKSGEDHKPSEVIIDRELGEVYVKNGDAVEIDREGNAIVPKVNNKKIEKDGEV